MSVVESVVLPQIELVTESLARESVNRARRSLESAAAEVVWQVEREVWVVLGYKSWDAMREAEYGGAAVILPTDQRPEFVERLRAAGRTQQQIADTAGVALKTVRRDLASMGQMSHPVEPEPEPKPQRRNPLPTRYQNGLYELGKSIERMDRLHDDDRFGGYREEFRSGHINKLLHAKRQIDNLIRDLTGTERKVD